MALERKTPLPRSRKPMKKSRLNPVNRKRREKRFLREFGSEERVDWYRRQPCDTCGKPAGDGVDTPLNECSHVVHAAGKRPHHMVPQCRYCHLEYHAGRETFEATHNVDMMDRARHWDELWEIELEGGVRYVPI